MRGWRLGFAIVLLLLIASLILVWAMRMRLAADFIDDELERRGVQATYDIARIGFGRQVLENVVIGDPARPDATARRVEVGVAIGLTGPRVSFIRARGVRLFGRYRDGRLSFGEVDRLMPPPSGLPFRLPDQRVDIADAAIAIDTPAGRIAFGLAGRGNLSDGFRGGLAIVARRLRLGSCEIAAPRGRLAVEIDDLSPHLEGPLAIAGIDCGADLSADRLLFALDAALSPAIDSWRGQSALRIARIRSGPQRMERVEGRLTFAGDAERVDGEVRIGADGAAFQSVRSGDLRLAGRYRLSPASGRLLLGGAVEAEGLAFDEAGIDGVAASLRGARGTPVGPIAEALADALDRAARGGARASARLAVASGERFAALRLQDLSLSAPSGARLSVRGGDGIVYDWTRGALRLDGDFRVFGGGFPDARFVLRQDRPGGPLEGVGRVAPIRAGEARLALGEIDFTAGPAGTYFSTRIVVDGPIGSGRITGLSFPLSGRFGPGGLAIGPACVSASFDALVVDTLRIGPTSFPLCPTGPALVWAPPGGSIRAGARISSPRLAGRLGRAPIVLAASSLGFGSGGFSADALAVRVGGGDSPHRLDVARLSGRFASGGAGGRYSGLSGQVSGVPLLVSEGEGAWRLDGGTLRLAGPIRIADARDPVRFHPLVSEDFTLTLAGDRIEAGGRLRHPASGTEVAVARIEHRLRSGAGHAVLDVPGIRFGPDFQPEALTPLTIGVVALVDGTLTGQGRIEWDSRGTRSSGRFATADADLAAPFGPVEGLTTGIEFTDLLALTSAPGQVAEVDLVRAGVDVYDGRIVYQLQPNYHVAIESARWPFAGGALFLQPTILDFSQPSTKYLTFRVDGLDAARFVAQMEFSNIAATGTFDGLIPMEFDQSGGRVVGGRMRAREGGGTLSYVGELTDRDLGIYGKMAFDALKELRYDRFDIALDGDLAGEFLTRIELDGVARDPGGPIDAPGGAIGRMIVGRALSELARIPFEFNIRIQGPFRALLATARSFEDPSLLIQPVLPRVLRDLPTTVTDVQDEESEDER